MNLQFPASIQKIQTMVDGGNKIVLETPELNPDEMAVLFRLKGQVWAVISDVTVKQEDIKIPDLIVGKDEKSPSEQLRSRMAVYYKEKNGTFDGFPTWYSQQLDQIGAKYLDKLN